MSAGAIGQIWNCASDARVTIRGLDEVVVERVRETSSKIHFVEPRIGDIYKFDIDNQKLKSELGFKFLTSFEAGLDRTYEEMRRDFHFN